VASVLVVIAHPDDETLQAGTLAKLVDEGHEVAIVCATRGEVGEIAEGVEATAETLGRVREAEMRAAAREIGVEDVRFLDYRDSGMAGAAENEDPRALVQAEPLAVSMELTAVMQELNPDVIITWDASGGYGHPDHIRVHETTRDAFDSYAMRSGRPVRLYYMALPTHLFEEMQRELAAQGIEFGSAAMREARLDRPPVTTEIDVAAYQEAKRRSRLAHRSQLPANSPWEKLSEGLQRRFYGTEYFHRAVPPWNEGEARETALFERP